MFKPCRWSFVDAGFTGITPQFTNEDHEEDDPSWLVDAPAPILLDVNKFTSTLPLLP